MTYEDAQDQKASGGVSASQLKNFAFSNGHAFSLNHLITYYLSQMQQGVSPGNEIKKFVKREMFESDNKDAIIIVYHGAV